MISEAIKTKPQAHHLVLANGTVELLKWLALFFMTLDHFNKYVYNGTIPYFFELGRLAMPIFSFVFAYNLARSNVDNEVRSRVLKRLFALGLVSSIPYIALGGVQYGWWPLNILFTLFTSGLIIHLIERKNQTSLLIAFVVFVLGGSVVEFWWPSILMTITTWFYCRSRDNKYLVIWLLSTASLYLINQNIWALGVLPILLLTPYIKINFPRWRNAFYFYYPAHLSILWLMTHNINYG